MLAQEMLDMSDPKKFAEEMWTHFRDLLSFIEEKKGELPESQAMYFDQFAQSLIAKFIEDMDHCEMKDLAERKDNLDNVDQEMASYAEQLRSMIA